MNAPLRSAMEVAELHRIDATLDEIETQEAELERNAQSAILNADGLKHLQFDYEWMSYIYADVARMNRCLQDAAVELARLPEEQTRSLTGLFQAALAIRMRCLHYARKDQE
jgi:hypothetical protein